MPLDPDNQSPGRGRKPLTVIAVATIVAAFVALHLTGVLGAGAH